MDWYQVVQNDWEVYHNKTRIALFVQKGKITATQYEEITGEPYSV
jgi:uncharacterized XkdX family phage protein